ncbi:MAG: two-component system CheB/CheR fusion protein [Granulosicoccus sp.]|jgi:two-component system CheB/CheR fusion protein
MPKKKAIKPKLFVAIGASAGGIGALKMLLPNLPVGSEFTYLVTLHMDPTYPSVLDQILEGVTLLKVEPTVDGMLLEPDHLYVTPSDKDCTVIDGVMHLEPIADHGTRNSVDLLFASIAVAHNTSAVGIVLSGTGHDGVEGARAIKAGDGLILVQDPADTEFTGMPTATLNTGLVDVVAPASELGPELVRIFELGAKANSVGRQHSLDSLRTLTQVLLRKTGFAFDQYKDSTLNRRVERRMIVHKLSTLDSYIKLVERSDGEAGLLLKEMQISVTAWFRDDAAFVAIAETIKVIVANKRATDPIRVWVPGCATGEEAFSIAVLIADALGERLATTDVQIFATDADLAAITHARISSYSKSAVANVPQRLRKRYFDVTNDGCKVSTLIRDMVVFAEHDLMLDPPFSRLDLVSCRNVLIYFKRSVQVRLLKSFHYVLNPGAKLFLGPTEGVSGLSELFGVVDVNAKVYVRNELEQRVPPIGGIRPPSPVQSFSAKVQESASPDRCVRDAVFDHYAPANVLVNKDFNVVRLHGELNQFMQLPQGNITVNILDLVVAPLRLELRLLLQKVERERSLIHSRSIKVSSSLMVTLVALPAGGGSSAAGQAVVLFDTQAAPDVVTVNEGGIDAATDLRIRELEQELIAMREHLQTNVEELEASNEELQSINEEFQTTTEELQSSNEELQTTNEELQSTNEELHTVNDEMRAKSTELEVANVDLEGVLNAVTNAVVVLDANLKVTRYSLDSNQVLELLPASIGRPLSTVGGAIDLSVLSHEINTALRTHKVIERELDLGDQMFIVRLIPNPVSSEGGLVISFQDETNRIASERTLRRLATVVQDSRDAITVADVDGTIVEWNRGAHRMYGFTEDEAVGMNIAEFIAPEQAAHAHKMLRQVIAGEEVEPVEVVRHAKDGRELAVWLTATALLDQSGAAYAIAITENDLSEHKLADIARRQAVEREAKKAQKKLVHQKVKDTQLRLESLTPREREVMTLLVAEPANASSAEIGIQLGISGRTVDTHRRRIREKMAAQSLPDLVDKARICGLLNPLDT